MINKINAVNINSPKTVNFKKTSTAKTNAA